MTDSTEAKVENESTEDHPNSQWEYFVDSSYYDMWCVRKKNDRTWGNGFHVMSHEEAVSLHGLLSSIPDEADKKNDATQLTTPENATPPYIDLESPSFQRITISFGKFREWVDLLASGKWSWVKNSLCKYVTIRIDTRSGVYSIRDRDDKKITFDHLMWQYSKENPHPPT